MDRKGKKCFCIVLTTITIKKFPEYEEGETKTYTIKISNSQLALGASGEAVAGKVVSKSVKKKISDIVVKVLGEKIGSKFIPGLSIVSSVAAVIGALNFACGNDGFIITVDLEYSSVYMHKEGVYMYGWDIMNVDVETY